MQCSSCGCEWDSDGFYHRSNGESVQPCKVCYSDSRSVYYLNNAERIRERERQAYYDNLETKRAYYREYRRQQRAQAAV